MGYWNIGMLEYWVWRNEIYFHIDGACQKIKSGNHPLFMPNIPFFHHSIIPIAAQRQTPPCGVKYKPGCSGPGFSIFFALFYDYGYE